MHVLSALAMSVLLATVNSAGASRQMAESDNAVIRLDQECRQLYSVYAFHVEGRRIYLQDWNDSAARNLPTPEENINHRRVLQWWDGRTDAAFNEYRFICEPDGWLVR